MSFFSQSFWMDENPESSNISFDLFETQKGDFKTQNQSLVSDSSLSDRELALQRILGGCDETQSNTIQEENFNGTFTQSQANYSKCGYQQDILTNVSVASPSYSPLSSQAQANNYSDTAINERLSQSLLETELNFLKEDELESQSHASNAASASRQISQIASQQTCRSLSQKLETMDTDRDETFPHSVNQLYEEITNNHSDWTFLSILAGQFAGKFFPVTSYINLKMSLLISIVSIRSKSPPIPIVAIGDETDHANKIMNSIGRFADRFITSSNGKFDGSYTTSNGRTEAGPLFLASNGVLRIGEWEFLQPTQASNLLRVIETGQIQQSDNLKCAIWTFWSYSSNIKKDLKHVSQFLNCFGIPIMIDDPHSENDIIDDLFDNTDEKLLFSDEELQTYLSYVSRLQASLEPEAEQMLNLYYSATRKLRENALSPRAFDILKQMAESHAKLCFRTIASTIDALAAINICEKFIRALFERDSYSSPVEPKITCPEDFDKYQGVLLEWYSDLINSFSVLG